MNDLKIAPFIGTRSCGMSKLSARPSKSIAIQVFQYVIHTHRSVFGGWPSLFCGRMVESILNRPSTVGAIQASGTSTFEIASSPACSCSSSGLMLVSAESGFRRGPRSIESSSRQENTPLALFQSSSGIRPSFLEQVRKSCYLPCPAEVRCLFMSGPISCRTRDERRRRIVATSC